MSDDSWGPGRRPSAGADGDPGRGRLADRESLSAGERGGDGLDEVPTARDVLRAVDESALAPVIPLFGAKMRGSREHPARGRTVDETTPPEPSGDGAAAVSPIVGRARLSVLRDDDENLESVSPIPDRDEIRERAEAVLLRKLRSRSLSLSEARTVVRGVDGADDVIADDLIDHFVDLGYLDDSAFAEQLAMSAVERRGEGRRAVAETLRKRGIPRDVADAVLAELPDDDAERALDFARSKVRGVEGKDHDAALRRLAGQLSRRGYPSSIALTAARAALEEAGIGRGPSFRRPPSSGVRFTPDE